MSAKITEIVKAIAQYIHDARPSLPIAIRDPLTGPVDWLLAEEHRNPIVNVYPVSITRAIDTRDSYRLEYRVGVTVTDFLQIGSEVEIEDLELLVSELEELLEGIPEAGVPFWSIADESERQEFEVPQVDAGSFFVATIPLTYVEIK